MTDNVLQSFCERCGTRFTQPAPPERPAPAPSMLGRFRRKAPETAGWSEAEALPISDAFRDTFRFCLECRRYNCADCWNEREGHCLSCRPLDGTVAAGAGTASGAHALDAWPGAPPTPVRPVETPSAWPTDDLARTTTGAASPDPWTQATGPRSRPEPAASETLASQPATTWTLPTTAMDGPAGTGPSPDAADSADTPAEPTPELDPWRGVAFTAEERGRTEASVQPFVPPGERAPEAPSAAAGHGRDMGVLASLMDDEPHVDAAGWARASSAVVGTGQLKASRAIEESSAGPEEDLGTSSAALQGEGAPPAPVAASAPEATPAAEAVSAPTPATEPEALPAPPPEALPAPPPEALPAPPPEALPAPPPEALPAPPPEALPAPPPEALPAPPPEAEPVDDVLAPLPETEAWLAIARGGLVARPAELGDVESAPAPDDAAGSPAAGSPADDVDAAVLAAGEPGPGADEAPPSDQDQPPILPPARPAVEIVPVSAAATPGEATPGPADPAPASAPAAVPAPPFVSPPEPAIAVWVTHPEPGPFMEPYHQAPSQISVQPPPVPAGPPLAAPPMMAPPAPPAAAHQPVAEEFPPPPPTSVPGPISTAPPVPYAFAPAPPPPPSPGGSAWTPPPMPGAAQPPAAMAARPSARPAAASRACPSCALPLSTKARFCRRCGAPQPV